MSNPLCGFGFGFEFNEEQAPPEERSMSEELDEQIREDGLDDDYDNEEGYRWV